MSVIHIEHDFFFFQAEDGIRDKRDGRVLSDEAIEFVVRGATNGSIPDYQLSAWLMAVRLKGMTDQETKTLTLTMAASGRQLDLSSIPGRKVDKHSTGGVGDKATLLVAIGANAGRETVAYVADMEQPLGRAVGNALEVGEAIETLSGHGPPDLEALSLRLGTEMLRMAGTPPTDLRRLLTDGTALRKFAQLIDAQSGDSLVVSDLERLPRAPFQRPVPAGASGQVAAIDALEIALAAKSLGAGRDFKDAAIDLSVGVVLRKKVGDRVQAGESLATIHAPTEEAARPVTSRVAAAFPLAASAQPRPPFL